MIKSQRDFFAGLMFGAIGVAFAWGATNYNIGTGARMGPGYFPLILGVLLAALGLLIMVLSLTGKAPDDGGLIGRWAWRPLFFVILSNFLFGVLLGGLPSLGIPSMGLMVAIFALTFVAALGGDTFRFKEVLIVAIILAIGSYLTFVMALKLQFQVWPAFITG
ncbi:MAG: tripartite tricarboxylate transporter TctB family protein [Burkholderiales bacterium]